MYFFFLINVELSDAFACLCRGPCVLVAFMARSMKLLLYIQFCSNVSTDLRDKQKPLFHITNTDINQV